MTLGEAVQASIDSATAELRRELEEVRRERDGLRQIDVPTWVLELSTEEIPAHQILPLRARMSQAVFLPWVSSLLRTVANERDALKREVEELRGLLRERVFYTGGDPVFTRQGYSVEADSTTAIRDINYRNVPLYGTPDEAIDAALNQREK